MKFTKEQPVMFKKGIGHMIEHVMENCSSDTVCIIKHDFWINHQETGTVTTMQNHHIID